MAVQDYPANAVGVPGPDLDEGRTGGREPLWAPVWPHQVSSHSYWATSSQVIEPVCTRSVRLPSTWQGFEFAAAAAFFADLETDLQVARGLGTVWGP